MLATFDADTPPTGPALRTTMDILKEGFFLVGRVCDPSISVV